MAEHSIFDILRNWKGFLKEEGTAKYTYNNREEYLEKLVLLFKKHGVDYDSAKAAKRKVQETLITKEGMKGRGKYTGWPKNVEEDYLIALAKYYVDSDTSDINPLTEMEKAPWWQFEDDEDGWIKKWITETSGYSDRLYLETRRIGTLFWMEYLKARFS